MALNISCNDKKPEISNTPNKNTYATKTDAFPLANYEGDVVSINPAHKKAISFVEKAITYAQKNGLQKTIKEINEKKLFVDGEYYVFIARLVSSKKEIKTLNEVEKFIMPAHPINKALRNVDLYNIKDPNGKPFPKAYTKLALTKGKGWVTYYWSHPKTKKLEQKHTYLQRFNNDHIFFCGVYK